MTQEASKNVYQRILGVMADVDYIEKGSAKVNGQYRFVSHDQVTAKLHPFFVKHGLVSIPNVQSMQQDGNRTTIHIVVSFVNVDNPSDRIEINSWGHGIDPGDKGIGKAYSYAYKYALLKTFNLETGDDPDQDSKAVYKPEKSQEDDETLVRNFLKQMQVPQDECSMSYIESFCKKFQKSVPEAVKALCNKEKFNRDLAKWKEILDKKKSA